MCGIAGVINFKSPEDKTPLLRKMIQVIRHRGPDAMGIYDQGPAGLGHARLSIIDLNTGDQPVYNEDRSICIVYNGEVFNYPDLRRELIASGHRFYTETDTEVLVHLYEEHGTDMFRKLNGQFAFALWDSRNECLLLGRDRVGIRPLFYHEDQGRLVFGSEIKAIFMDTSVSRRLDVQTVSDIFCCWSPMGSATAFEGIHQLPPGHFAVYSRQGLSISSYWALSYSEPCDTSRSSEQWVEEMGSLLEDAARIRLRADVPVGAYLSGGIDSTYISSLIKHKFDNHLNTFSVGFADPRFDETRFQKIAAERIGTDHHYVHCTDADIGHLFPEVIWHTEVPVLRTAPVPLYMLSALVRENRFKVVLTGEGADEVFAGYNIFKEDKVRRFCARGPDSTLRPRLIERLYPYIFTADNSKARAFLEGYFKRNLTDTGLPYYSHALRWQNTSQIKGFLKKDLAMQTGTFTDFTERVVSSLPSGFMNWDALSRAQYFESTLFLSNYLLSSQGDRMAMGHSVEGRYPFLDYRVIEMATRIPADLRLNGLTEKYILKKIARGFIPDTLIDRPKQPYRAPISACFFGKDKPDYVDDLLSERALVQSGYFEPQKVMHLINKCRKSESSLLSERENMAICGILSTQLIDHMFIRDFPRNQAHSQ
jgi:asparagine synthase (glutamine-hydrolysing)